MKIPEWLPISCGDCKHFNRAQWGTCAAYPTGIPVPIASGEIAHTTPQPGDHGIQFEPTLELAQQLRAEGVLPQETAEERIAA